ncbi:hypothetical protein ISS08_00500 [Candidatus Pacearchaeota archaeon]|nr:hypothetical protein [Candidatus Pacearchaeota archaeon]
MENILISEKTFEKARKIIKENKGKNIIFTSENDDLNRKILEKEKIAFLLLNQKNRKDFAKQRNSGLNQVLIKIAKKNGTSIAINLEEIIKSNSKEKAKIISRIIQNIKLCNKYHVQMKFFFEKQFLKNNESKAFGSILGMPTWMTKNF